MVSVGPLLRRVVWALVVLAVAGIRPAPGGEVTALVGGTVLDLDRRGRSDLDLDDAVVILDEGRIQRVGRRDAVEIPKGARVVDVSGRWLVPGLVDAFGTLNSQAYANAYLALGVTSLIAVDGGRRGTLFPGADPGPSLLRLEGVGREPQSTDQLLAEIQALTDDGYRVALLMYGIRPDQLPIAVTRAEALGLATIGELGLTRYDEAVGSGIDAFVHTTRYSLDLAPGGLAREVAAHPFSDDLASPKWRYYRFLSDLPASDPRIRAHARVLGGGGVFLVPTLSLLYLDLEDARNPWREPAAGLLDPAQIDSPARRDTGRHDHDPEMARAYADLARRALILERAYRTAGASYLAGSGTDVWGTMPGISLHTELELLTRIGLTPREAIAAATANVAEAFGWGHLGLVAEDRVADLLVLSADPRKDISNLKEIEHVILGGRMLDPAELLDPPAVTTPDPR